jgi:hypothetical protein
MEGGEKGFESHQALQSQYSPIGGYAIEDVFLALRTKTAYNGLYYDWFFRDSYLPTSL